ncbi:ADP-ribosyltransferase [Gordonia phage Cafasso]|uniref:ADP-ribosyltransferase n=1 Tax=Gordonia phage Cafasso TaxID=2851095 RepID=A0AAE7SK59_9CAUD|nr:ADP-ribosyltransferase [Gordonia phage Cafasso]
MAKRRLRAKRAPRGTSSGGDGQRHVRTPAGMERYNLPMDAPIEAKPDAPRPDKPTPTLKPGSAPVSPESKAALAGAAKPPAKKAAKKLAKKTVKKAAKKVAPKPPPRPEPDVIDVEVDESQILNDGQVASADINEHLRSMIKQGQLEEFDEGPGTTEEVAFLLREKANEFGIDVADLARQIDDDAYDGFDSEVVDSVMAAVTDAMKPKTKVGKHAKPEPAAPAPSTTPTGLYDEDMDDLANDIETKISYDQAHRDEDPSDYIQGVIEDYANQFNVSPVAVAEGLEKAVKGQGGMYMSKDTTAATLNAINATKVDWADHDGSPNSIGGPAGSATPTAGDVADAMDRIADQVLDNKVDIDGGQSPADYIEAELRGWASDNGYDPAEVAALGEKYAKLFSNKLSPSMQEAIANLKGGDKPDPWAPPPAPDSNWQSPSDPDYQDPVDAEVLEILGLLNTPPSMPTLAEPDVTPEKLDKAYTFLATQAAFNADPGIALGAVNGFAVDGDDTVSAIVLHQRMRERAQANGDQEMLDYLDRVRTYSDSGQGAHLHTGAEVAAAKAFKAHKWDDVVSPAHLSDSIHNQAAALGVSPSEVYAALAANAKTPEITKALSVIAPDTATPLGGGVAAAFEPSYDIAPDTASLPSSDQLPRSVVRDPDAPRGSAGNPLWVATSDRERRQEIGAEMTSQDRDDWDEHEFGAMQAYTDDSGDYNNHLRGGGQGNPDLDIDDLGYSFHSWDAADVVELLDRAFESDAITPLGQHTVLARGCSPSDFDLPWGATGRELKALEGEVVDTAAYTSTSLSNDPHFGGKIRQILIVPPGVRAMYVDGDEDNSPITRVPGEREVILPRGLRRRIVSVTESPSSKFEYDVVVEVLP